MSEPSPCIKVCKVEDGRCIGCNRTLEEIANWPKPSSGEFKQKTSEDRIEELTVALEEARENMVDWCSYIDDYFLEKHDLKGDLARIDAVLNND